MRFSFLICLTLLSLAARENPFKPIIDNTVLPVTSNSVEKAPPFEEVKVQLPADARVLTSVAIYYQSIDGSIKKEIVAIDRSIDWHDPILITQTGIGTKPKKRSTKTKPAAAKAIHKKPSTAKRTKPTARPSSPKEENLYTPLPFISIKFEDNAVRIVTDDEKIRVFHLADPFKIAIDFRRDAAFLTKHRTLGKAPFKAVDIGNHKGYYRVVFTLDAPYRYTVSKIADGYIIDLR